MNENETCIRSAMLEDAEEILRIYSYYINNTAITFEYEVPGITEFRSRIVKTQQKYPYIVAVNDGEIVGYAYTGSFVGRSAYDWSAETTIYIKTDKRKIGFGKLLYCKMENISRLQNILNLNACIGYPEVPDEYLTKDSMEFHRRMGYTKIGEFHKCGYKFGRWYDMIWMEKFIGEHIENPKPVIPFSELDTDILAEIGIKR